MSFDGRRHHDMGGLAAGPVHLERHDYAPWEKRVDALMMLLMAQRPPLLKVDELRQNIETMGPELYDRLGYYERWMHALTQVLVKRGVVALPELAGRIEDRST